MGTLFPSEDYRPGERMMDKGGLNPAEMGRVNFLEEVTP